MKKIILLALILITSVTLLSVCSLNKKKPANNNDGSPTRLQVASTIFPLHDIIRRIGGEKIDARLILPPGSSPHTFEVSPSQAKEIQGAELMFIIGGGIDAWASDLASAGDKNMEVIDLSKSINLHPFEHQIETSIDDKKEHGDFDPHYWLDPANAVTMADKIAQELTAKDKGNAIYYQEQASAYKAELIARDTIWKEKLANLNSKEIMVFHDAWGYFAEHFGLTIGASFEPFPGKSPSPKYLKDLQDKVKEHNIKAIFMEPQLSESAASALAEDLKMTVRSLDPIGGMKDRASYIGMMDFNVNSIYEALK